MKEKWNWHKRECCSYGKREEVCKKSRPEYKKEHSQWLNHSGFSMEVLNSEVAMQFQDHTNGHKPHYWQHYKINIYIIIWLHMLAAAYKQIWNEFSPRKPLLDWMLFHCEVLDSPLHLMYRNLSVTLTSLRWNRC